MHRENENKNLACRICLVSTLQNILLILLMVPVCSCAQWQRDAAPFFEKGRRGAKVFYSSECSSLCSCFSLAYPVLLIVLASATSHRVIGRECRASFFFSFPLSPFVSRPFLWHTLISGRKKKKCSHVHQLIIVYYPCLHRSHVRQHSSGERNSDKIRNCIPISRTFFASCSAYPFWLIVLHQYCFCIVETFCHLIVLHSSLFLRG